MDKIVVSHLDEMDTLESAIDKEIDNLIDDINIEVLISNPVEYVKYIFESIHEEILSKYMKKAADLGEKFAKQIKKDGEVVIPDSKNPKLNEEILNG